MADSKHLLKLVYPTLETNLNKNKTKFIRLVSETISNDGVNNALSLNHPGKRVYFSNDKEDSLRSDLFMLTGVERGLIKEQIKKFDFINPSWEIANNEFNYLMIMAVKYFHDKRREQEMYSVLLLLGIHFYSSLQFKYFPYESNENIMRYMVNSLDKKFILYKEGTMMKTLIHFIKTNHNTYKHYLTNGTDRELAEYFINLRTRLNGMVKKLTEHYHITKDKKLYLNQSSDFYDDDSLVDKESDSGRILSIADLATEKFVSSSNSHKILSIVNRLSDVNKTNLSHALNDIRENESTDVVTIFRNILELFVDENDAQVSDIRSKQFTNFCLGVYQRSNTKDVRVDEIKDILDKFLSKYSSSYKATNREATKSNFRKAIYVYLVLFIQSNI